MNHLSPDAENWDSLINEYQKTAQQDGGDYEISHSSLYQYKSYLRLFAKFNSSKQPDTIQEEDITKYFQYLRRENKSIAYLRVTLAALRAGFLFWHELGHIQSNPLENFKLKTRGRRGKRKDTNTNTEEGLWFPADQLIRLFNVIEKAPIKFDRKKKRERDWLMFAITYATGLRAGEIFPNPDSKQNPRPHVLYKQYDLEKGFIRQVYRKNNRIRDVRITKLITKRFPTINLLEKIKHFAEETGIDLEQPLFNIKQNQANKMLKKWLKIAGLNPENYTIHNFRHSTSRHLILEGVPEAIVQQLMDHQHPDSTRIYTQFVDVNPIHTDLLLQKLDL